MADNPTSPAAGSHESGGEQSPRSGVREQDRYVPIANISRIMKKALPANGKIAKDAKDTVQECVSEFISFVTSEASDKKKQFGKEDCWKVFKDRIVIMETLIGPPVVQLKLSDF